MRKRMYAATIVGVMVLAFGTAACDDEDDQAVDAARDTATTVADAARDTATTVAQRLEQATRFNANLTGNTEVPGPGDTDGTGTATINVDVSKTQVCYDVTVRMIDRPTLMHIHEGEAGKAGPPVVTLNPPTGNDTPATGCVNADNALLGRIGADPGDFYVNVHTDAYPQGAVRGQLSQ